MQISSHRKIEVNITMGFGSGCNKSKQRAQEDAAWTDDGSGVCQVACQRLQLTAGTGPAVQPLKNHHLQPSQLVRG